MTLEASPSQNMNLKPSSTTEFAASNSDLASAIREFESSMISVQTKIGSAVSFLAMTTKQAQFPWIAIKFTLIKGGIGGLHCDVDLLEVVMYSQEGI